MGKALMDLRGTRAGAADEVVGMGTVVDVLEGRARWCVVEGECLKVLADLPSDVVACVVTDPPYSSGGMVRGDRMNDTRSKYQSSDVQQEHPEFTGDNRDQRGYAYWFALWASEAMRATRPGGMCSVFTDWRQLPSTSDAIQAGGWVWRGVVPWDKVVARPVPNRFRSQAEYMVWGTKGPRNFDMTSGAVYGGGIISVPTVPTCEREHSTQKPVQLMLEVLKTANPERGIVLDPFCGSGTTGVAAAMLGMPFVGCEMVPEIAAVARRRIGEAADHLFAG